MLFGISQVRNEVFVFKKNKISRIIMPKVKISTIILPLSELNRDQLKQIRAQQGKFAAYYLKLKYGSLKTYILLAYAGECLTHVQWIVPAGKIKARYPFVTENSYSIISCLTAESFRGLGIYPSQIQKVVQSDIPARIFWIWAPSTNTPSLKGIRKAGGIKVAEIVQKRWFWGCISHIEYFPEGDDNK